MKNTLEKINPKKISFGLWGLFVIAVIGAIFFWFQMNNAKLDYEKVEVKVVSAETTKVKNKKTGNTTNFYDVKVEYEGVTKDLENAHDTYSYPKGKKITAYLSKGRLFANEEGVKTATPVATVYFIFLFSSFILLFAASIYTSKIKEKQSKEKTKTKNNS